MLAGHESWRLNHLNELEFQGATGLPKVRNSSLNVPMT